MRAGERKRSVVVIKRRAGPVGGGVAHRAIGGEPCRDVGGIRRAYKIRLVAGVAVGGCAHELSANVATGARDACVPTRQWKLSKFRMIERCVGPVGGGVAH